MWGGGSIRSNSGKGESGRLPSESDQLSETFVPRYAPVPLLPRPIVPPSLTPTQTYNGTGARWDGDTVGWGHNRTEGTGMGIRWNRGTMGGRHG